MNILELPIEILTKIYNYGGGSNFALTCKLFNEIAIYNRIIKLDTVKRINEFEDRIIRGVIQIDNKLILIEEPNDLEQNIVVKENNFPICIQTIKDVYVNVNIHSCITNNTIIILASFNLTDGINAIKRCIKLYSYKFIYHIRYILDKYFSYYDYKILIIKYKSIGAPIISRKIYIEIYKKNISYFGETPPINYINHLQVLHLDNEVIYFSDMNNLYSYNYVTNDKKKITIPKELEKLSNTYIIGAEAELRLKFYIALLESVGVSKVIIDTLKNMLVRNKLYFKRIILTEKYLAVNYRKEYFKSYSRDCIIVFNLQSYNRSIISRIFYIDTLTRNLDYYWYPVNGCLQLWCINDDEMYISSYKYRSNIQKLYGLSLK